MRVSFLLLVWMSSVLAAPRHSGHRFGPLLFAESTILGPIYYSQAATDPEKAAARDLAEILSRISGHEWPVEVESNANSRRGIYVGQTNKASTSGGSLESFRPPGAVGRLEHAQTFRIVIQPKRILLIGATPESTVSAVYYFLETYLGARWFIPSEIGEELPILLRKRLVRPGSKTLSPSFLSRTMIAGLRTTEGKDWGQRNLLTRRWEFNHNLQKIILPELFESKPDWFSLHGDKRVPTKGHRGPNPNLANQEVARYVASEAIRFFGENPESETFSISITDNLRFDESSETLDIVTPFEYFRNRPNYSDLVFSFSNSVADEIWPLDTASQIQYDEVPEQATDKFLGALAYYWAEQIPGFPVHPRIIPYLTSDRGQWFSDAYRAEDKKLIKAWCATGPEIIGTWDYYEGGPYFIPRGFLRSVAESLPFLREAGVRAFFAEGRPMWGFDGPRLWLAAQLLWDTEQDSASLIEEFFEGYYQESAAPMRSFFDICEKVWYAQPGPPVWLKYYLMPSQAELFPLVVWEELESKLTEAEAIAETDKIRSRIALVWSELEFGAAMSEAYFAWKSEFQEPSLEGRQALEVARGVLSVMSPPQALRRSKMKEMMLEITELPMEANVESRNSYLLSENFREALVDGDDVGVGPLPFVGAKLRGGWSSSSFHNEKFNFSRVPVAHPWGNAAARIVGSTYFNLFEWLPVEPGWLVSAKMRFRGKISPGSRIKISLRWMDEGGSTSASEKYADIPVGEYQDWRIVTESFISSPNAAWVLFGVSIQEQMPGDFLEIDSIEVLESEVL